MKSNSFRKTPVHSSPFFLVKQVLRQSYYRFIRLFGFIFNGRAQLVCQPWDLPEEVLYSFLRREELKSLNIIIVGAHHGYELKRLAKIKSLDNAYVFEPSPDNHEPLTRNLKKNFPGRYFFSDLAVSDCSGPLMFYENNLPGTGSLLEVGQLSVDSYGMKNIGAFECFATTLDEYFSGKLSKSLVLWIDVQGAEMKVLNGSTKILNCVKYVFTEVSVFEPTYVGGCTYDEIAKFLLNYGFRCVQLGTDTNGTGNALFVRG